MTNNGEDMMLKPDGAVVVTMVALVTFTVTASAEPAKSTPDDRARIVALSKTYESDILAPGAKKLATEIVKWWIEVPDLTVNWCANLLTDEGPSSRDLAGAVTVQATAAAGVFVIENPSRASDLRATWIAGLEGVVRAYRLVLSKNADLRDEFLDKLAALHAAGKIGEYVDEHSKSCQ